MGLSNISPTKTRKRKFKIGLKRGVHIVNTSSYGFGFLLFLAPSC